VRHRGRSDDTTYQPVEDTRLKRILASGGARSSTASARVYVHRVSQLNRYSAVVLILLPCNTARSRRITEPAVTAELTHCTHGQTHKQHESISMESANMKSRSASDKGRLSCLPEPPPACTSRRRSIRSSFRCPSRRCCSRHIRPADVRIARCDENRLR
jgi:hypothetical protein